MKVIGYTIEIEGIDKTGKDLIKQYIIELSNYKYVVHTRGILSNMVYAEKYNRDFDYIINYKPIIIYLEVNRDDWDIRCKINHEPKIDYELDLNLFEKYINTLKTQEVMILRYNTSEITPINIAKSVLNYIDTC